MNANMGKRLSDKRVMYCKEKTRVIKSVLGYLSCQPLAGIQSDCQPLAWRLPEPSGGLGVNGNSQQVAV